MLQDMKKVQVAVKLFMFQLLLIHFFQIFNLRRNKMKTKLTHLIMASLILLCFVFSITGMSHASKFVSNESSYPTTSATGFDEGPITEKNYNGGNFEEYDPHNNYPQPPLDLELGMERVDYRQ